jgi:hypothetical protein
MASTNTWESPSFVDKVNCYHCVSPSVNSPELLRKHVPIVVLPDGFGDESTKSKKGKREGGNGE